jgi:junctophilin
MWYNEDEEEEDLLFSPALMARRASESWINTPPIESVPAPTPLQRKKSLPDFQGLPKATDPMSREEVSVLSSARREEVRRQAEEAERLRANPLLYLVSPHVKDWFSRQQLVMLVLFINISLAIMFFKLLT